MTEILSAVEKERINRRLAYDLWGLAFFLTGTLSFYFRPEQIDIAVSLQFLGALIVSFISSYRGIRGMIYEERNVVEQVLAVACVAALLQQDYFTAILVPLIIHIGQILEERSFIGIHKALQELQNVMQQKVITDNEGEEREVPLEDINIKDRIIVYPQMRIAVDGIVIQGNGWVDTSMITGESQPMPVTIGDAVSSGTVNLNSKLVIEVTTKREESTLGKIIALLQSSEEKVREDGFLFSFFPYYVPSIIFIFALILFFIEDMQIALLVVIALLPSGLILSSSITMMAMLSRCGQDGILIRDISLFSKIRSIEHICFDKTGTLTKGQPVVDDVIQFTDLDPELEKMIFAISQQSKHPICTSIHNYYLSNNLERIEFQFDRIEEIFGCGIEVQMGSKCIRLGQGKWLSSVGVAGDFEERGTGAYVSVDSQLVLWFSIMDQIREETRDVVEELDKKYDLQVLTGDRKEVAQSLKLPFSKIHAQLLPQDKAQIISDFEGDVLMVGDGINDAVALQRADVAIAFGGDVGEVLIGEADAVIQKKMRQIPFLIELSNVGFSINLQNVILSLIFSITLTIFVFMFQLPSWQVAIGVNLSALFVLLNCSRILLFQRK